MNDEHTAEAILFALFTLSRETRHISAATLAAAAHTTPTAAARALVALERAGLVDATRARLTMAGLVAAARLEASGAGGLSIARSAAPAQALPAPEPAPVAARSSRPPQPHAPAPSASVRPALDATLSL